MDHPKSVPVNQQADPSVPSAAEKAFLEFIQQLNQQQSKGFLSENEMGKIFSFETYLKETGQPAPVIAGWCDVAKANNFLTASPKKIYRMQWRSNARELGKFLSGALIIAICLYIIMATGSMPFNVSLWNWSTFIGFIIGGVVLVFLFLAWAWVKAMRKKNTSVENAKNILFVIKYFDSDELTLNRE